LHSRRKAQRQVVTKSFFFEKVTPPAFAAVEKVDKDRRDSRELSLPGGLEPPGFFRSVDQCSPGCIRPERRPGIAPGSRGWRPRVLLLNHHRMESRRRESHPPSPPYQGGAPLSGPRRQVQRQELQRRGALPLSYGPPSGTGGIRTRDRPINSRVVPTSFAAEPPEGVAPSFRSLQGSVPATGGGNEKGRPTRERRRELGLGARRTLPCPRAR
jgi:hypothetical protein